jgi:hypothetical protein
VRAATPLADLSEKEWSDQLVGTAGKPGLARTLGWNTTYHTLRSKGSDPGYPDWHLVRERSIFLELKTELGKVSDAQAEWIRALHKADAEVYVVRPSHLEEIAHVLQHRGVRLGYLSVPRLIFELESVLGTR